MHPTLDDEQPTITAELSRILLAGFTIFQKTKLNYELLQHTQRYIKLSQEKDFVLLHQPKVDDWFKKTLHQVETFFPASLYLYQLQNPSLVEFEEDKYPRLIHTFLTNLNNQLHALEKIIMDIEEQEKLHIQKEYVSYKRQDNELYWINVNHLTGVIRVNGIEIGKYQLQSIEEKVFTYIFQHPNQVIKASEMRNALELKRNPLLSELIVSLGFSKKMQKLFFPLLTSHSIKFINPITKDYWLENDLPKLTVA